MVGPPSRLTYRTFPPPPGVAGLVDHLWAVRSPVLHEPRREVLVPDGRPTVAVPLEAPGTRVTPDGARRANDGLLSGVAVEPVVLEEVGPTWYVGARLVVTGAPRLTGGATLADDVAPLGDLLAVPDVGALLRHAAETAPTQDGDPRAGRHRGEPGAGADLAAALALAELLGRRAGQVGVAVPPDRATAIDRAVERVEATEGRASVVETARAAAVHPATLRRWFERYVGVSPKTFATVVRFHVFVGHLLAAAPGTTSVHAALQGYADASHAARDVRRYSGLSPRELRRRQGGIARLMHGLPVE